MSYLVTPELPEFKKATISFWFKVPQAALDAAQKESDQDPQPDDPPPFWGLVPLVVFGKEGTGPTTSESSGSTQTQTTTTSGTGTSMGASYGFCSVSWFPVPLDPWTDVREYSTTTYSYTPKPGKPTNPSFIAIQGDGTLVANFESTKLGDVTLADVLMSATSKYYTQDSVNYCFTYMFLDGCDGGGDSVPFLGGLCGLLICVLFSAAYRLLTAVPDKLVDMGSSERVDHPSTRSYGSPPGDAGTGSINSSTFGVPQLAADTWHHVLVSVDMSGGSASTGTASGEDSSSGTGADHFSATSLMYIAIDDVNYKTVAGSPFPDTNKVVTGSAAAIAGSRQTTDYNDDGSSSPQGPVPSYSLTDMSVPAAPVGIPSVDKYVDHIRKVEMAEFLFFTDLVVDTGQEGNRRPFITAPDKNGYQNPTNFAPIYVPIRKFAFGDPATWEPGADNPAFAPPLFDPSIIPTGVKVNGAGKIADIDFTKCQWNWQMGLNLGKLPGKCIRTGKIRAEIPPVDEPPRIGGGGG